MLLKRLLLRTNKTVDLGKNQISLKPGIEESKKNLKSKTSNNKVNVINEKRQENLEIEEAHAPFEMVPNGNIEFELGEIRKKKLLVNINKKKSGIKEVYSQLADYNEKQSIGLKGSTKDKYQEDNSPQKIINRKTESKHESYLDKLEDNSITDEVCEIKHQDLLNYIPQKLLSDINNANFDDLSPRSQEINSTIMIIKKSFKEYNKPPITTTDFYKIGRMLGKGAFGKVNLGMHKIARKLVAIKSMNKDFLNDTKAKKKLMKEVSIIKRTRHPNVVKLYETFESGKHVLFSMEM